jgi:hypothetical protein
MGWPPGSATPPRSASAGSLGGGIGLLVRKHGLTIDDLLAAEVVTADGHLLQVDDQTHSDPVLGDPRWRRQLRRRHQVPVPPAPARPDRRRPAAAGDPDTIAGFVAEAEAAPEELSTIANILPAPPLPFVPAEHHGKLVVMATLACAGDVDAGQGAVAPLRALATRSPTWSAPSPTPRSTRPRTRGSTRPRRRARCSSTPGPRRDRSDPRAAGGLDRPDAGGATAGPGQRHGAGARRGHRLRPPHQPAHGHVAALYQRPEEAEVHQAWVDRLAAALRDGDPRAYVNFLGEEGQARIRQAIRGRPGTGWRRSRPAGTPPTCSTATRTSHPPRVTPMTSTPRSHLAASRCLGARQHPAPATAMGAGTAGSAGADGGRIAHPATKATTAAIQARAATARILTGAIGPSTPPPTAHPAPHGTTTAPTRMGLAIPLIRAPPVLPRPENSSEKAPK